MSHGIAFVLLLLLLVPLAAAVLGVFVFRVNWVFFGKVRPPSGAEPAGDAGIAEELKELAQVCDARARRQRLTFVLCLLSAGAFFITLTIALVVYSPFSFCP